MSDPIKNLLDHIVQTRPGFDEALEPIRRSMEQNVSGDAKPTFAGVENLTAGPRNGLPLEPSVWQPIETAKKDQSLLLVDSTPCRFLGYWNERHQGWFDNAGNRRDATHWIDPGYPTAETKAGSLCEDCPPVGYPTDKTRCAPCPRTGGRE